MKVVTIRGIEPEISNRLKKLAAQKGQSMNQLTVEIIKEGLGLTKEKTHTRVYDDLDDLFGRWSTDEYEEISTKISRERRIDSELWQ